MGQNTQSTQQKRFSHSKPWQLGLTLAWDNLGLIGALGLLAIVSNAAFPLWAYLLIVAPAVFTLFWLWWTQTVLNKRRLSLHDAFLIAKASTLPFVAIVIISAIGYVFALSAVTPSWLWAAAYYGMIFGVESFLLNITVVVFGLRHHFMKIHV